MKTMNKPEQYLKPTITMLGNARDVTHDLVCSCPAGEVWDPDKGKCKKIK